MTDDPADSITLCARMARLAEVVAFAEAFVQRHGIARADGLRLSLVVEELFTNTVMHGHGGDSDAPVRIALRADTRQVVLDYEDSAAPFDPRAALDAARAALGAPAAGRPVGGLGLALVAGIVSGLSHVHADGVNRLHLTLPRKV